MRCIPLILLAMLATDPVPATPKAETGPGPERLENAARLGIQRVLSNVLDAPVEVGKVSLAKDDEGLELRDVRIGNPDGFAEGTALSAETVRVEADVRSLFSREPQIRLIRVAGAQVHAQTQLPQGSNIARLLKNARDAKREGPFQQARQKQWRIEKGVLDKTTVKMDTQLLEKSSTERTLEPIEMTFLGEDGRGMPAQQAVAQFLARLLQELDIVPAQSPANQVLDLFNTLRK